MRFNILQICFSETVARIVMLCLIIIDDPTLHGMDAGIEEQFQELLRESSKGDDCITEKLHEDKIVKKARKGGDMEDSFDLSELISWERGVCSVLLNKPQCLIIEPF